MATTLGSLILELGIDDSKYKAQLKQAERTALQVAKNIESHISKTVLPETLNLKTKVDDAQLYELNKHLSLKEEHFKSVQRSFDQNPLTPHVDFKELEQLETALNRIDTVQKRSQINVLKKLQ